MKQRLVLKLENKSVLDDILEADSFVTRLKGYMFQKKPSSKGILFKHCNSLHSFFMGFDIDLYFLDDRKRLVKCVRGFERNKTIHVKDAAHVLETPSGAIDEKLVEIGQTFYFVK